MWNYILITPSIILGIFTELVTTYFRIFSILTGKAAEVSTVYEEFRKGQIGSIYKKPGIDYRPEHIDKNTWMEICSRQNHHLRFGQHIFQP